MKTTTHFTEMVKGIIADAYDARNIGEWHALFNWYDETKSDKVAHDSEGQLVDLVPFCSDWCHEQWCRDNGRAYEGWNGAHEHPYNDECDNCEAVIVGVESFVDA